MSKRQASSELNHDNWDQEEEEEKETAGTFTPVDKSLLQHRVIRKAKRSLANTSGSSPSSPFAAFSGFANRSTKPSFSFVPQDKKLEVSARASPARNIEAIKEKQNGCSESSETKRTAEDKTVAPPAKKSCPPSEGRSESSSLEYYRQLQTLNESVLKWMQLHLSKNPCCDFTPVFNDYKGHLVKLEKLYPPGKKTIPKSSIPKFSASTSSMAFKMPSQPVSSKNAEYATESTKNDTPGKDSTNDDDKSDEMLYGAGFASNTTNTSSLSFSMKTTPTATSSFSSGPTSSSSSDKKKKEQDSDESKTPFSFGLKYSESFSFRRETDDTEKSCTESSSDVKPFSFAVAAKTSSESGSTGSTKEDDYVPPKNDFVPVSEEGALYSKKCKLFYKKDEAFIDRGIGMLYVKPVEEKMQLLIRADTNLGNILLNIMLSASLPMQRTGKNNVLIVCVPNPPMDAKNPDSTTAVPVLVRVKTAEDADELLEMLNKYKS